MVSLVLFSMKSRVPCFQFPLQFAAFAECFVGWQLWEDVPLYYEMSHLPSHSLGLLYKPLSPLIPSISYPQVKEKKKKNLVCPPPLNTILTFRFMLHQEMKAIGPSNFNIIMNTNNFSLRFRELLRGIWNEYGNNLFALLYFAFGQWRGPVLSCKWTRTGRRAGGPLYAPEDVANPRGSFKSHHLHLHWPFLHDYDLPCQLSNGPKCDRRRDNI